MENENEVEVEWINVKRGGSEPRDMLPANEVRLRARHVSKSKKAARSLYITFYAPAKKKLGWQSGDRVNIGLCRERRTLVVARSPKGVRTLSGKGQRAVVLGVAMMLFPDDIRSVLDSFDGESRTFKVTGDNTIEISMVE